MNEIRELITFYDAHGWEWTDAACYTLIRQKFGSWTDLRRRIYGR